LNNFTKKLMIFIMHYF